MATDALTTPAATVPATALIRWLNLFRTSELYGMEVLIRMMPLARDSRYALDLHRHAHEESWHARLWAQLIVDLDGSIHPEPAYQRQMVRRCPSPRDLKSLLVLNVVTEMRATKNYEIFARLPSLPEQVRRALQRIVRDERWHVEWQFEWLRAVHGAGPTADLGQLMDLYRSHDLAATEAVLEEFADPGFLPEQIQEFRQMVALQPWK